MSDKIKDGGPAFPTVDANRAEDYGTYGMTLRDYFAAKAMQAGLTTIAEYPDENWRVGLAMDAYAMADAMLKARKAE